MKYLILCLLCSCSTLKGARFVDNSEKDPDVEVWVCVPDDDPANAGGLMCADFRNVVATPDGQPPSDDAAQM